jgi:hypothetical protein
MARLKNKQLKRKTFDVEAALERVQAYADDNRAAHSAIMQQAKEQGACFTGALAGK